MSEAWARGSTRAWRRLRDAVLERDAWRCQYPITPAQVCGAPANTAGHIIPRSQGGPDRLDNLRAECPAHNYGDGARIHATRQPRTWSW